MRNKIIGVQRFTRLLENNKISLIVGKKENIKVGDIIRLIEVGDEISSQTGRWTGVIVVDCKSPKVLKGFSDQEMVEVNRLPIICPKSTVDEIWPEGTHQCIEKGGNRNEVSCPI